MRFILGCPFLAVAFVFAWLAALIGGPDMGDVMLDSLKEFAKRKLDY